jgi:hypothetical protein
MSGPNVQNSVIMVIIDASSVLQNFLRGVSDDKWRDIYILSLI